MVTERIKKPGKRITAEQLLLAINRFVIIGPNIKEAIFKELGLIYNPKKDPKKHIPILDIKVRDYD